MEEIEQFRAEMRKLGYTDQQIEREIDSTIADVLLYRKRILLDTLRDKIHEMTTDELKKLKNNP